MSRISRIYKRDLRGRFASTGSSGRPSRRKAAASTSRRAKGIADLGKPPKIDFGKPGGLSGHASTRSAGFGYTKAVPVGSNYQFVARAGIGFERTTAGPIAKLKKKAATAAIDKALKDPRVNKIASNLTNRKEVYVGPTRLSRNKKGGRAGFRATTTRGATKKVVSSAGRRQRRSVRTTTLKSPRYAPRPPRR